jgi:citrate synthase
MSATETQYPYSPGLEGVPAGISRVSEIDVEKSVLEYRGYNVHDLASNGSYEETAFLLLHEHLPTVEELTAFKTRLAEQRVVPDSVWDAMRAMANHSNPMNFTRTGFSVIAGYDPDWDKEATDQEANLRKAERIIARAGTLVAGSHRIIQGKDPIAPDASLDHAANLLYMIDGAKADDYTVHVMDTSLTLYAEHGFNASTFACRVCVSTLSDIYSGIVAGICTLKGPLHGGANEAAMKMLLEIGSPDNAEAWVTDALAHKKKIMGFGHREYKHGDSRAFYMTEIAKEIGKRMGNTSFGDIADILEKHLLEKKGLYPNVDFPTAYAYYLLGIPIYLYTPLFVAARVAGWTTHAIEQLAHNRLIRPKAIYEGSRDLRYVPLAER